MPYYALVQQTSIHRYAKDGFGKSNLTDSLAVRLNTGIVGMLDPPFSVG